MSDYPRAVPNDPPPPFLLDRIVAYAILTVYAIGFVTTLLNLQKGWVRAQDTGAIGPVGYLASAWSTHVYYLLQLVRIVWVCQGLMRSRPWSVVALAFVSSMAFFPALARSYWVSVATEGPMLAYALLRLFGRLGPQTSDRFGLNVG